MVEVWIAPAAARQLDALPLSIRARRLAVFERLTRWPEVSGAKPLRGALAGRYRARTGDYRVQFRVDGSTLTIDKVGHRDRFYED